MACILIVEDDADTREALTEVLTNEGFEVRICARPEEAVAEVTRPDAPALVLLDSAIREASGTEFLDWMEKRKDLDSIPVVLVTADPSSPGHERAVALLRKPYDLEALLQVAYEHCKPLRR